MQKTNEIDIHTILAERRQIAIIWSIEDVRKIRPDLTETQAWEVLQEVAHRREPELVINWQAIEIIACDLFP